MTKRFNAVPCIRHEMVTSRIRDGKGSWLTVMLWGPRQGAMRLT